MRKESQVLFRRQNPQDLSDCVERSSLTGGQGSHRFGKLSWVRSLALTRSGCVC